MATSMRNTVVVILGATGTGKTKLSLELARRFNGEIISADSMQVYKGLDIITNKATMEERKAVPHHLIDYLSPLVEDSTVVEFRDKALPIIDSLLDRNKVPIIVGGTNYYIESLLWKHLINKEDVFKAAGSSEFQKTKFPKLEGCNNDGDTAENGEISVDVTTPNIDSDRQTKDTNVRQLSSREGYAKLTTQELYQELTRVDTAKAKRIHPNDRRKLLRALEVYGQYGIPMSALYEAQHGELGQESCSGPLRYPHTCMFWLQSEMNVLKERLDARVDKMIEDGLLTELTEFHKLYNAHRLKQSREADYTTGIFQSIGFKEFHNYLLMNEEEKQSDSGLKAFEEGKEALKVATRRYAKVQNRFVINRFLKRKGPQNNIIPLYGLDSTDVSAWTESVSEPAISVLEAFLQGKKPDIEPVSPEDHSSVKSTFVLNKCVACDKVFTVEHDFVLHQKTRRHRSRMTKYKRKVTELSQTLDQRVEQLQREKSEHSRDDHQDELQHDFQDTQDSESGSFESVQDIQNLFTNSVE